MHCFARISPTYNDDDELLKQVVGAIILSRSLLFAVCYCASAATAATAAAAAVAVVVAAI